MYNHNLIEKKWQKFWKENKTFKFIDDSSDKFYVLDMFPYPSGKGLHVGHPKGYTATDIISRYKRLKGFNVLHPIGWDAFGLPAEQYALDTNNHPNKFTKENIDKFREQLQLLGFDYDYNKEVNTTDPKYYKWTQWIFSKLFEHGLAEVKDINVNWCEELKTTLSNEEVLIDKNGNQVSERGSFPVIKKPMRQWVLKITNYADKLIEGLNDVDWPESLKSLQLNWIGKSVGHELSFLIEGTKDNLDIFTTRLDTLYGVTFLAISPEHPLVNKIIKDSKNKKEIEIFLESLKSKNERELLNSVDKNGIFTGQYAINPINNKKVPIWIGDYVLTSFGTGAMMGVPAHDQRDFNFAKKYKLEVIDVIESFNNEEAMIEDGLHINSEIINGKNISESIKILNDYIIKNKIGKQSVKYKLRDWIFSRQRYWGEPFPILFDENNNISLVKELPLLLPETNDFKPSESGKSPLDKIDSFMKIEIDGKKYIRDSNTMPQWAGSCWYYLGYILKNDDNTFLDLDSPEAFKRFQKWLPVDIYIGGQEHAVLHLLYARFWHRFLYDIKIVPTKEPFYKIINQGMILGENGEKMSKSAGNVINPDDIVKSYGADSLRLYEAFMGPLTATLPWTDEGISGIRKWLNRVERYYNEIEKEIIDNEDCTDELKYLYNKLIFNFEKDIELQQFNIAISEMMIFMNALYKEKKVPRTYLESFLILLSCYCPHLSEELWSESLGNKNSVCLQKFPTYNDKILDVCELNIPFQINGKLKKVFKLKKGLSEKEIIKIVENNEDIKKILDNKKVKKKIIIIDKIVNYLI